MDNLNRKMDGLLEQFGDMKEDLLDNRKKIAVLDKELIRRNAKLVKLEGEVQEGKTKFLKAEDELVNYKIKVVSLEEEIEKSNSKIVEVETELIKSKGKVSKLEQKLAEYTSRTESWVEEETGSASPVSPKQKVKEISRRLKVLEEKTDRLSSKVETQMKLKHILNGMMLRAQKNYLSDKKDWSLRASLDNILPMTPAAPPRMTMPQPGFFASALRGQNTNSSATDSVFLGLSRMIYRPASVSKAPASSSGTSTSGTAVNSAAGISSVLSTTSSTSVVGGAKEDETAMFVERCHMFHFDQSTSRWKERGVGELKILSNNNEVRFRIVMLRDQILKLCANHFISKDMTLKPPISSDRSWCYNAVDFSEEEVKMEKLAVRFNNADMAKKFKDIFTECQTLLKSNNKDNNGTPEKSEPSVPPSVISKSTTASPSSTLSSSTSCNEMIKAKPGSWECNGCYLRNDADVAKCPACLTPKSGSVLASLVSAIPSVTNPAASSTNTWDKFKPKPGSWQCSGCYIVNDREVLICPACESMKPGTMKKDLPKSETPSTLTSGFGGFRFGVGGSFSFGDIKTDSKVSSSRAANSGLTPKSTTAGTRGVFQLGSGGEFTFGVPAAAVTDTKTSSSPSIISGSTPGCPRPKFGSGGGFTFGNTAAIEWKAVPTSDVTSSSTPQSTTL